MSKPICLDAEDTRKVASALVLAMEDYKRTHPAYWVHGVYLALEEAALAVLRKAGIEQSHEPEKLLGQNLVIRR